MRIYSAKLKKCRPNRIPQTQKVEDLRKNKARMHRNTCVSWLVGRLIVESKWRAQVDNDTEWRIEEICYAKRKRRKLKAIANKANTDARHLRINLNRAENEEKS